MNKELEEFFKPEEPFHPVTHMCSVERLVHFHCCSCKKWWTISDWKNTNQKIACPWCHVTAEVVDYEKG